MAGVDVLERRLRKIDEYLAILAGLSLHPLAEFRNTPEYYGAAERFLHLAIECLNDIGNHLIADHQLGVVESYRDIPAILHRHGHLSREQEDTWIRMIGFRNILVHDYLDIDHGIVYDALHQMDDIRSLQTALARFL
ncbi:MAG: DUF86 domain-containing protein [Thermodesulfobacteriota bacterium]